ncbi:hypothetical protein H6775_02455 [Candidatus Nomurabacteria bacterium]|nr:hypothetical protein [Candidatus Nomurabacteria bacterium]
MKAFKKVEDLNGKLSISVFFQLENHWYRAEMIEGQHATKIDKVAELPDGVEKYSIDKRRAKKMVRQADVQFGNDDWMRQALYAHKK